MSTNEQARVTHTEASQALDSMDDYARMEMGVDAHGPRGVLERYIAQQSLNTPAGVVSEAVERLREIAYRDEAVSVTVRADDLRAALEAALSAPEPAVRPNGLLGEMVDMRDAVGACCDKLQARIAELGAEPAAQGEVLIEAVGRVERDMTGELCINWLVEGGIHALIEGSVLLCSEHDHLTDDDGSVTLYTAPPAQPAERVPEGWLDEAGRLYDAVKVFPEKRGNPVLVGWDGFEGLLLLRNHVGNLLTASPAPSESDGGKGVDRG